MSNKVFYYFAPVNFHIENKRVLTPATTNKVKYIISTINRLGYKVHIISYLKSNTLNFLWFKNVTIFNNNIITYMPSFKTSNYLLKIINYFASPFFLIFFFLFHNFKIRKFIVYHSTSFILTLVSLKFLFQFQMILELEEIYYLFDQNNNILKFKENLIVNYSSKFILSNNNLLNFYQCIKKRGFIIINGVPEIKDNISYKVINPNNISIVYVGGIDKIRNSVVNALNIIKNLPFNFVLKLAVYGDKKMIKNLNQEINFINTSLGREACINLGTLNTHEVENLLMVSDIGLNPQNLNNVYMDYAFPSKLFLYLSYGLKVFSTKLDTISLSQINEFVTYFDPSDPVNSAKIVVENSTFFNNTSQLEFIKNYDRMILEDFRRFI